MAKGINNVCQRYNGKVLFYIKHTPGDISVPRTSGGIYTRTYPEGYFMQNSPLAKEYVAPDKPRSFKNFLKKILEEFKIRKSTVNNEPEKSI